MNSEDKKELKEILRDHIAGIIAEHNAQLTIINAHLSTLKEGQERIEEQTTKTNGTVREHTEKIHKLEKEDLIHFMSCPQTERIETLGKDFHESVKQLDSKFSQLLKKMDESLLTYKFLIQHPWFAGVAIGVVVIGTLVAIIEFYGKIKGV